MSSQNPTADGDDRPSIVDSEPCESCGGSGLVGSDLDRRWCDDCINIPEGAIPDNPPANPYERVAEMEEKHAEIKEDEDQCEEVCDKLAEAQNIINDAAEIDVVDDGTAAVLNHLSSRLKEQAHPFRRRRTQQSPVSHGSYHELQNYIDVLEDRQGLTEEDVDG